jgi:ABC-type microcin C transport system permease subunit YejE
MVDLLCNISLEFLFACLVSCLLIGKNSDAYMITLLFNYLSVVSLTRWQYLQVKILNKLAAARASGMGGGSKVLTDLVQGLQEPAVAVELRLKINQNHPDLKGG